MSTGMSSERRVRLRPLVAVALAVLFMTACAGLPTSERVDEGNPVVGQPLQNPVVLPAAPEQDAEPNRIVDGFVRANAGFRDDHDTAQLYLTPELADQWRPTSAVVIYDGEPQVDRSSDDRVRVTVDLVGTLDSGGRLVEADEDAEWHGDFHLQQLDGQWRVASFPDGFGLLLSSTEFSGQYTQRPITYLSTLGPEYIMDRRWFPNYDQGGLPTALARAQLQPVPEYLDGAVEHGFPSQTELAGAGVPVDPGTFLATIELTGAGTSVTDEQMEWMWVQLAKTLTGASGVSTVSLRSAGYPMTIEGVEDSLGDPSELGYSDTERPVPFALLRVLDTLQPVSPDRFDLRSYNFPPELDPPQLPSIGLRWVDLATDAGVTEFAAVSFDRAHLARWEGGESEETVMTAIGTGLTAPSYDGVGGLWVAGQATSGPMVWWIDRDIDPGQVVARSVSMEWLENEGDQWEVGAFRVAPDDTRAVIYLQDPESDQSRLGITAIVRDDDGQPVSLTPPMWVAEPLASVSSIAWEDQDNLLILGQREQDSADVPYHYPIGGWLERLGPVDLARGVRAGTGSDGDAFQIVLNQQGNIFTREGPGWGDFRNGDDVVIPGY